MATAAPTLEKTAALPPREGVRIWVRHLLSLYVPGVSLAFVWTGPHPWYVAPLFMVPLAVAHHVDCAPRLEPRQPAAGLPAWPFDALVILLAALQLAIVALTIRLFTVQGLFSLDMLMVFLVVGGSSGFSIITAHELIHRRRRGEQLLGRLLLSTVLYEHFYTEHLRGHHLRVGTPEDPATARFGEGYEAFFRRTVPAQLRSAWRLECRRLGDESMAIADRRQLGNRVLHGLLFEWGLALGVAVFFGPVALAAFLLQAFMAVRLLEAVNYFEHWGLLRAGRRVTPVDSWDTHSWFTYYGLIGLSRHADHHAWPARPYQQLRVWSEAPMLPFGYVGMVDLVMGQNAEFQQRAARELARRRLGPFVPEEGTDASPLDAAHADARLARAQTAFAGGASRHPGALARAWRSLSLLQKQVLFWGAVLLGTTLGVQWETGGAQMGFAARLLLHGWIFAAFFTVLPLRAWIQEKTANESLSWVLGFGLLCAIGLFTDAVVRPLLG